MLVAPSGSGDTPKLRGTREASATKLRAERCAVARVMTSGTVKTQEYVTIRSQAPLVRPWGRFRDYNGVGLGKDTLGLRYSPAPVERLGVVQREPAA